MGPRAGERYVQVIAPAFGLEAALAARPGTAVSRHPTPEHGLWTDEIDTRRAKIIALPLAVDHHSHRGLPACPSRAPCVPTINAPMICRWAKISQTPASKTFRRCSIG